MHRHGFHHVFREGQRPVIDLGAQAFHTQQHRQPIRFGFADVGHKSRVVQANQRRAGFDDLPFANEQLGHDPAFEVLDLLQLGRGNRLAVATGDLVDHRKIGPYQHEHEEADDAPDGQSHHARGVFDQRLLDLGQGLPIE